MCRILHYPILFRRVIAFPRAIKLAKIPLAKPISTKSFEDTLGPLEVVNEVFSGIVISIVGIEEEVVVKPFTTCKLMTNWVLC